MNSFIQNTKNRKILINREACNLRTRNRETFPTHLTLILVEYKCLQLNLLLGNTTNTTMTIFRFTMLTKKTPTKGKIENLSSCKNNATCLRKGLTSTIRMYKNLGRQSISR